MKIGIITTHYAINYGAFLQAMALQRTISEMGHDCEIIDYRPNIDKFGRNYIHKVNNVKGFVRNIYAMLSINYYLKYKTRRKKFDNTREREMRLSEKVYVSHNDVLQNLEPYDAFVCGSDQIWNLRLMYDPVFFLDFREKYPEAKYIAYAPSTAMSDLNELEKKIFSKHMRNFDALSVREAAGKTLLSTITDKEIKVVLDPVLLYGTKKWEDFSKVPKGFNKEDPYIFCYYIGSSRLAQIAVDKIRKITGYRTIYCNVKLRDRFHSDECIRDASPQEFVGLIKNASFVCSNSFHATVFSVLFKKPFIVTLNHNGRDSRMVDLLSSMNLNNRLFDLDNIDNLNTEAVKRCAEGYDEGIQLLKNQVDESKGYLKKYLG